MRKTRKIPILTKYPRHPDAQYEVSPASSTGYLYVKMFRDGRRSPTSPTIYRRDNLPRWMVNGMSVLDVGYDALSGLCEVPGFGKRVGDTYTFFKMK